MSQLTVKYLPDLLQSIICDKCKINNTSYLSFSLTPDTDNVVITLAKIVSYALYRTGHKITVQKRQNVHSETSRCLSQTHQFCPQSQTINRYFMSHFDWLYITLIDRHFIFSFS